MYFIVIQYHRLHARASLTIDMICFKFSISVYDVLLMENNHLMTAIMASHPLPGAPKHGPMSVILSFSDSCVNVKQLHILISDSNCKLLIKWVQGYQVKLKTDNSCCPRIGPGYNIYHVYCVKFVSAW